MGINCIKSLAVNEQSLAVTKLEEKGFYETSKISK